MQAPVFFVVGPVGHGKTTVREALVKLVRLKGGSCSDVIYHFLAIRKGVSVESLRALPKESFRPELIAAGDFLCGSPGQLTEVPKNAAIDAEVYRHPSALIRTLYMNGVNIIDGVRRRLELEDARVHLDWNGVQHFTIHVSNPRAPKIPDNSEDLSSLADEQVINDGTVEELEEKIRALLIRRFPPDPVGNPPVSEMPVVEPTLEALKNLTGNV